MSEEQREKPATPEVASEPDLFSIVRTTSARYFGVASSNGKGVVIDSAYEIPDGKTEPKQIAEGFIRGRLYGDNRRIELSDGLVESTTEAPDETRIVRTYEALLPEAERRAMGVMTYKALQDLLSR